MDSTRTPELTCYNFRTQKYDDHPDLTSDASARQYIPQYAAAQGIYGLHREMGQSITEAMIATLTAVIRAAGGGQA
jgi:hypothetical protein